MFAHRIWTGKMCVLKVTFQVAESAVIACLVVILFNKKDNSSERGAVGLLLSSGAGSGYQSTAAGATCRPEIDICSRGVHGNVEDWDPMGPMGFPREWE